jgi:hypothetical protein
MLRRNCGPNSRQGGLGARAFGRDAFRLNSFEQAFVAKRVHAPSKAAATVEYREAVVQIEFGFHRASVQMLYIQTTEF